MIVSGFAMMQKAKDLSVKASNNHHVYQATRTADITAIWFRNHRRSKAFDQFQHYTDACVE